MRSRSQCKKDAAPSYDPQVGAAAQANAALAQKSEDFSEDYFNKYVAPMLKTQSDATQAENQREQQLSDMQTADMQQQDQRYQQYGVPAENAYYGMVSKYAAPDQQEEDARSAIGDVRTAAAGQKAGLVRSMQSMGVDPSSPAAISAMSDMAVQNTAAEAGAATRARSAARQLGMSLTSDAANFGRGTTSAIATFGQQAGSSAAAGSGVVANGVSGATSGANPVLSGYGVAQRGYGANLDAYSSLQKASLQANAENSSGLGSLLGTMAGAAITKWSDRRLKTNIDKLFTAPAGFGVYQYNYIWEPKGTPRHVGVMADEIEKIVPEAVIDDGGYKAVDYSKVVS